MSTLPKAFKGTRPSVIFMLLLSTIVVTGILAFQAQYAIRSHRLTAEAVLEDYAGLAARVFVRNASSTLGYYGLTPVFKTFKGLPWPQLPLPTRPSGLDLSSLGSVHVPLDLRLTFCRFTAHKGQWWQSGPHPQATTEDYLGQLSRVHYDERWPFALVFSEDNQTVLAYRRLDSEQGQYEGMILDLSLLKLFFKAALDRSKLMPFERDGWNVDNQRLTVKVQSPHGEIFHNGPAEGDISAEAAFDYGFQDMRVQIGLDRALAPGLIIGGLPGSRLPLLLALLLLTVALVVITLVQIRRERSFAERQSDSMAAISHELRTPLAQIQMFSETLLLNRVRSPGERRRALEIIHQETKRMADLVDNVVRFSSALHGLSRAVITPVDGQAMLQEQIEHFAPMISSSGSQLRMICQTQQKLMADPRFLRRMLRNLIDNALKYSPSGSDILLGQNLQDGNLCLWVEDSGEGIPESERKLIWERFERRPCHRNTAVAGTGIGLWLVRELAHAQNAKAWVEDGDSGGARFVLAFPPASGDDCFEPVDSRISRTA